MDATTLRLILVVIGAVFLIGLYLWERQRAEGNRGARRVRRPPSRRKQEPKLGPFDDGEPAALERAIASPMSCAPSTRTSPRGV